MNTEAKRSSDASGRLRVGVVGCGAVATAYYLPYLKDHADLVAVCDLNADRAQECQRLFGARRYHTSFDELVAADDIDALWIVTGPGTHKAMAIAAAEAGKHILLQKPMALTPEDCDAIVEAVRRNGVKCLVEPTQQSPVQNHFGEIRRLVRAGALGDPYWFSFVWTGPDRDNGSLGGNPYGAKAFYTRESGGIIMDYAYGPSQIVSVLGPCRSVMAMARLAVPERWIAPESHYDSFLKSASDPERANYWDAVLAAPRSERVTLESEDTVNVLYEMADGWIGMFHVGRPFHPIPKGLRSGSMEVFGTEGNLYFDPRPGVQATMSSTRRDLIGSTDEFGWRDFPVEGDWRSRVWPKPVPGGFNYYHESSSELMECIRQDRDPFTNVEWGRHINEMLTGAIESARSGRRYTMTSTIDW